MKIQANAAETVVIERKQSDHVAGPGRELGPVWAEWSKADDAWSASVHEHDAARDGQWQRIVAISERGDALAELIAT